MSLPENSAFLPLNVHLTRPGGFAGRAAGSKPVPLLALVAEDQLDELSRYNWRSGPSGRVFRQEYSHELSQKLGRQVALTHSLAELVEPTATGVYKYWYFENGDSLDCRWANIKGAIHSDEVSKLKKPGSSFNTLPEYKAALKQRLNDFAALAAKFPAGRKGRLSPAQVRQFLDELLSAPLTHGQSLGWLAGMIESEAGFRPALSTVRALIRGEQQRQPGFDYTALAKLFPGRKTKQAERAASISSDAHA